MATKVNANENETAHRRNMNKLRNNLVLLCSRVMCTVFGAVLTVALAGKVLIMFESVPGITATAFTRSKCGNTTLAQALMLTK
jgi:hypothetical protein